METRGLLTLFALALLVALGWWVLRAVQSQREAGLAVPPQTPDYYLYNFTMTAMNAKGQPSLRLSAPVLVHYPTDDRALVTQPHLQVYRTGEPPWDIDAERARILDHGKRVFLIGRVKIVRPAADGHSPVTILTRDVHVRPDQTYAYTDQPVTMISNGLRVDAVGLRANWKLQHVQLLSRVRGVYEQSTAH